MNIERICDNGLLSNGNSFQEIRISSTLDCIVDCDGNIYSRHNKEKMIYFNYQLDYEESLDMSLYDIKKDYIEYFELQLIHDK